MFVVYAARGEAARLVRAAMPPGPCVVVPTWAELEAAAMRASCLVVCAVGGGAPATVEAASTLRGGHPEVPLVVVVERDHEVLRHCIGLDIDAVAWIADVERSLPAAMREATMRRLPELVTRRFAHETRPSRTALVLVRVLLHAPHASLDAVAGTMGIHRTTLHRRWREHFRGLTPSDCQRLGVVARACGLRLAGRSWRDAASELGLDLRTLRTSCQRLSGMRPMDLAQHEWPGLADRLAAPLTRHYSAPRAQEAPVRRPHRGRRAG